MVSQADLDQSGTRRQWIKSYMGPSVGWVQVPLQNILKITIAGTYLLDDSTNLVEVNVNGAVTIRLPSCVASPATPQAQPGTYAQNPITIVDTGGFANTQNIIIQPQAGQTIMGLASVVIDVNYGGYTLQPFTDLAQWNSMPPSTGQTVLGPATTVVNDLAIWGNTFGTLLKDGGGTTIGGTYTFSGAITGQSTITAKNITVTPFDFGATGNGSTDDSAAIQSALNSGASSIYFPTGTFACHGLVVPSTVNLLWGPGVLLNNGGSYILLFESFPGDIIVTLRFNNAAANATVLLQQTSANCANVKFHDCHFSGAGLNHIFFFDNSSGANQFVDCQVVGCRFDGYTSSAVIFSTTVGSSRTIIRDNVVAGSGSATGHCIDMHSTTNKTHFDVIISGNQLTAYGNADGIFLGNATGFQICNNFCQPASGGNEGIAATCAGGGTLLDGIISNNIVWAATKSSSHMIRLGINDTNAANLVQGVKVTGNVTINAGAAGIFICTNGVNIVQSVHVDGNYVLNPSQNQVAAGIWVFAINPGGTASNIKFTGNVLDTNTSNTNAGIELDSITNTCQTFNNILNTVGGANTYVDSGTSNVADHWLAYTPVATPTVTPGTFAYTSLGRYRRIGLNSLAVHIEITITTLSTAAGVLNITVPVNAAAAPNFIGFNTGTNLALVGHLTGGTLATVTAAGAFPATGAQFLSLDGVYQIGL